MFSIKADIIFKVVHMYAIISKNIHFVNREFANTGMHPKVKIYLTKNVFFAILYATDCIKGEIKQWKKIFIDYLKFKGEGAHIQI